MKKWIGIILILLVISLVGCSKTEKIKDEDVLSLLKEYKTEQYTIADPKETPTGAEIATNVKEYLTEDALEEQEANRNFQLAPDFAKNTNHSIELTNVNVSKKKENDDGTVIYTYNLSLKLTDVNNSSSQNVEKKGELTVSNETKLIITKDWQETSTFKDQMF
ncbi:hypothetical protein CEQ21_06135 [Niallia circulans]|uniref:Lipoprotein n=1 Tax=Niallia circulans TaxID=1397 RepID=A0A553SU16_NIACI|nr:hypothetical protein [Niallia circulans]TRZ40485.1 hypothetical protein CEQ21_06135 [Niallia circulans]